MRLVHKGMALAAGAVAMILTAIPASAATTSELAPLGAPPGCFHVSASGSYGTVTVHYRNDCRTAVRVKFIISRAVDSDCNTYNPGAAGWWKSGGGIGPRLDKVITC